MSEGFHVDLAELQVIATRLHSGGNELDDQRNAVPSEPADAGASSELLATTLVELMGTVTKQLDDLGQLITNLGHARAWYVETDQNARLDILRPFRAFDGPLPGHNLSGDAGGAKR